MGIYEGITDCNTHKLHEKKIYLLFNVFRNKKVNNLVKNFVGYIFVVTNHSECERVFVLHPCFIPFSAYNVGTSPYLSFYILGIYCILSAPFIFDVSTLIWVEFRPVLTFCALLFL